MFSDWVSSAKCFVPQGTTFATTIIFFSSGATRDEVNISNSNELQAIIMERNQQQLASDDALFGDAPSKKKRKITLDDDDLHGYVTLSHQPIKGLIVKKAGKSREDIHIPLVSDQLKLLFDFLTSEGTDCLASGGAKHRRNYEKSGKFKAKGSKAAASDDDADAPNAGDSNEE